MQQVWQQQELVLAMPVWRQPATVFSCTAFSLQPEDGIGRLPWLSPSSRGCLCAKCWLCTVLSSWEPGLLTAQPSQMCSP